MAAVFDIELHDVDTVNKEESDDDVIEIGEVITFILIIKTKLFTIYRFSLVIICFILFVFKG